MNIIRASEMAEYTYCARAWWLRRVAGLEPEGHERRALGTARHEQHGRRVRASSMVLTLAGILFVAALGTALVSFL